MGASCFEIKDRKKKKGGIEEKGDGGPSISLTPMEILDKKIEDLQLEIGNLQTKSKALNEEVKTKLISGDKEGAKRILKEKKKIDDQLQKKEDQLLILEEQKMNLEHIESMKDVMNAIRYANAAIKEAMKGICVEDIENMLEDLNQIKENQEIINDFFTGYAEVNDLEFDDKCDDFFKKLAEEIGDDMPINDFNDFKSLKLEQKQLIKPLDNLTNEFIKTINPELAKEKTEREKEKKIIIDNFIKGNNQNKKNEILEDMCKMGCIMKKEIIEKKKNNSKKLISIENALSDKKNKQIFCLGVLAQNLENMGIVTAIEKKSSNDEYSQNASNTILQFITNGLISKNKYNFHFDFGEQRNNELLTNKVEQKKFNDKLRKKLSIEYNIPENQIILTNPQKGSYEIQVIFETDEFNHTDILDMDKFRARCKNDNNFKELCQLKQIHKSLIMEGCMLSQNMLDSEGNRESGWEIGGKRGGYPYTPPQGWKGFGLKAKGKYDGGNDDWIACNGNSNEWAVAYHGTGTGLGMTLEQATHNIVVGGFKPGGRQAYQYDDDANHPGQKVGKGVYCSPNPNVMDSYAKKTKNNGKTYKMGFMMRVKPDKIRYSNSKKDYWVLDGTTEQIRPYRILIKEAQ